MHKPCSIYVVVLFLLSASVYSQNYPDLDLQGTVIDSISKNPVQNASIIILNSNKESATNNSGQFEFQNLSVGNYRFKIIADGYKEKLLTLSVDSSLLSQTIVIEIVSLEYSLDTIDVFAAVFKKPEIANTGFINVNNEEIRRTTGSAEDVIRYFQSAPGVSVADDRNNDILVHGGSSNENLLLIDGIEIPNVNHYAVPGSTNGALSYINLKLVNTVDFYTAGFPAVYGDRLSSAMDIKLREGDKEHHHQTVNFSAVGFGGFFEGPVTKHSSYMLSIRRSYFELLKSQLKNNPMPDYWDLNIKLNYDLSPHQKLSFIGLGALDKAESFDVIDSNDYKYVNLKLLTGGINYVSSFPNCEFKLSFSSNYQYYNVEYNVSIFHGSLYTLHTVDKDFNLKMDYNFKLSDIFKLDMTLGSKYYILNDKYYYADALFYEAYVTPEVKVDSETKSYKIISSINLISKFLNGRLVCNTGLRYDYFEYINNKSTIAPRFGLTYNLTSRTRLNASAGVYYQTPEFLWLLADPDNRNLSSIRSENYVIGAEHFWTKDIRSNIEAYYKRYHYYPVNVYIPLYIYINNGADISPNFINKAVSAGKGYFTGIDMTVEKKNNGNGFYGSLNLSFTHSSFLALTGDYQPSEFDYGAQLLLLAGYNYENSWLFGFRIKYAGGRPYTPFNVPASEIVNKGRFDDTKYNKEQLPYYLRVDARIDKNFKFGRTSITIYGEVENMLNRDNVCYAYWDHSLVAPAFEYQWSILPIIGFSVQF